MTYMFISWSSDFDLYLEDYLMYDLYHEDYLMYDNESVLCDQ